MKNKRKDILYIAVGIAFVFAVFLVVSYLLPSTVVISEHADAKIKYVTEDKNIEVTLDDSDCDELRRIFSGKTAYHDSPSCGFTESASVSFGSQVFMPACDGDGIIKVGLKYITVSEKERDTVDKIFAKYGATFPCF
ncbi:hypothetical protein [Ruminococcus sp.]|uniref:hypothetical protein n=1 Tax=Ruminococcus sp. TaxID=41978 RepID=UPI003F0F991C